MDIQEWLVNFFMLYFDEAFMPDIEGFFYALFSEKSGDSSRIILNFAMTYPNIEKFKLLLQRFLKESRCFGKLIL
ncbi:MAG: hypothetical protein RL757_678 [Bacteroidota bacterium]